MASRIETQPGPTVQDAGDGEIELATHERIDPRWSGRPTRLRPGEARAELVTRPEMAADASGLVHGGFLFSLADHAAMLAVNDPRVVLAAAEVRFLRPVAVGDRVEAEARVEEVEGKRRRVTCTLTRDGEPIFSGTFQCAIPSRHVLAPREESSS